jgi:hypothetical protein
MSIRSTFIRSSLAAAAIALAGCALDPQGGYRPVTQVSGTTHQPLSFDEANAQCWTVSMNNAGYGATMAQLSAYQSCMARNGWQDQRTLF